MTTITPRIANQRIANQPPQPTRPPLTQGSLELLDRAHDSLLRALTASSVGERYVAAHLAALRAAAAVLAVRGRPTGRGRPRSVWEVLPGVAPELGEWATFFNAGAARRAAVEAGRDEVVSTREADDLVRDAESFLRLAGAAIGLRSVPLALPLGALPVAGHER